jgi:FixJ family two-component response regulator
MTCADATALGVQPDEFQNRPSRGIIPKYNCAHFSPLVPSIEMNVQLNTGLVAIVDDDESMRAALQDLLSSVGIKARPFASAEEFLLSGLQTEIACLISDIRMPGMTGLELQAKLVAEGCKTPIIFLTAYGNTRTRMQALGAGAVEFLVKPFDDERLISTVRAALES